jgi:hypothetical protein
MKKKELKAKIEELKAKGFLVRAVSRHLDELSDEEKIKYNLEVGIFQTWKYHKIPYWDFAKELNEDPELVLRILRLNLSVEKDDIKRVESKVKLSKYHREPKLEDFETTINKEEFDSLTADLEAGKEISEDFLDKKRKAVKEALKSGLGRATNFSTIGMNPDELKRHKIIDKLRTFRFDRNLSLRDFSKKIGCSEEIANKILHLEIDIEMDILDKCLTNIERDKNWVKTK